MFTVSGSHLGRDCGKSMRFMITSKYRHRVAAVPRWEPETAYVAWEP
jgi:hypothetical protein